MSDLGTFGCVYAPAGIGKTLTLAPLAAVGLMTSPQVGGSLSMQTFYGVRPKEEKFPRDLASLVSIVRNSDHEYNVIDDLSILVDQSFSGDWNQLGDDLISLRDVCEKKAENGQHVWSVCHEAPSRLASGKNVRGGPQLPGQYPEKWSSYCYTVLRGVSDPTAAPWPYVFWSRARPEWIAKDRLNVFPDMCPMNVAEGLRAHGYKLPRPHGKDWMDGVVNTLATKLSKLDDLEDWRDVLRPAAKKLNVKRERTDVRWVLEDSLHREIFRRKKNLDDFFAEAEADEL